MIWISWIDDLVCVGPKEAVLKAKEEMMARFECDDVGDLDEYIGCKLERNVEDGWVKFTQPVLLQSFEDEFELPKNRVPNTPAEPGQILVTGNPGSELDKEQQKSYRSGVGKLCI